MVRQALCWRVRSALTQWVNGEKGFKASYHVASRKFTSGQLPFSG